MASQILRSYNDQPERYCMWFRHSGMEPPGDNWMYQSRQMYTLGGMRRRVEGYKVTHMILHGYIPPNIHQLVPELTHLKIRYYTPHNSDLLNIFKLRKLEVLLMYRNDFGSEGIPDIFTHTVPLRELHINWCKLKTLPRSIAELSKLDVLDLSWNNFGSEGIPDIFFNMVSLRKLDISRCKLTTLPRSMRSLQRLQKLNIQGNKFATLPEVVWVLKNLLALDISYTPSLISLDAKILELTQLQDLRVNNCTALRSPPREVCNRKLPAIKQYYIDLAKGEGLNLPMVTIAVIGNTMAGKTSLIRTLQNDERKRVLTSRSPDAKIDEATKVFNVEEVRVDGVVLRVIDMGGQEIYHITYQLTLKQNCIPIVVVNIVQYKQLSNISGHREAVRRLAFDWLAQLYLANPDIGPPKLVFTHKDIYSTEDFSELKLVFLNTTEELRKEIVREGQQLDQNMTQIEHFSDTNQCVFASEDIYEVGDEKDDYTVYDEIRSSIFQSSQKFIRALPKIWEEVNDKVLSLQTTYSTATEIFTILHESDQSITEDQLKTILTYLHDCGKVLCYGNIPTLRPYIFHKIKEVTKLLTVLYHHGEEIWQTRFQNFQPCLVAGETSLEKEHFEYLVTSFRSRGVMEERLLRYLIRTETAFTGGTDFQIAVTLLHSFRLLYGPLSLQSRKCYIVPYFCFGYHESSLENSRDVTLRVEMLFKGLSVPQYVYHQMSVEVLRMFACSPNCMSVKKNGVELFNDGSYVHFVLDYPSRKVIIQVSSAIEDISQSWGSIVKVTRGITKHVKETWPASRMVHTFFCPHCLLKEIPHPERQIPPTWCDNISSIDNRDGMVTVLCGEEQVPSALTHPCSPLSKEQMAKLESVVEELKEARETLQPAYGVTEISSTAVTLLQRPILQADLEDDLSDLSDDDDYLEPLQDPNKLMVSLLQRPVLTTNEKIKRLFNNTDKVFNMTKIRGRALIINNSPFPNCPERLGSDADVQNLKDMLKEFKFKVNVKRDLSAKDMLRVIKDEVQDKRHADYGTFWMFLCSHGLDSNHIYGSDGVLVKLTDVYDLLTPLNFSGMADKPKLVVVQACAGERIDGGDRGVHRVVPEEEPAIGSAPELLVSKPPDSMIGKHQSTSSMNRLNYDNLLLIKSSFESFVSRRHPTYGSLLIRCLVQTMYRHACHRDMYDIYKIVQHRVRQFCIKRNLDGGQLVVAQDTLTHMRKLYLFPGYNGSRGRNRSIQRPLDPIDEVDQRNSASIPKQREVNTPDTRNDTDPAETQAVCRPKPAPRQSLRVTQYESSPQTTPGGGLQSAPIPAPRKSINKP